ncbi:hypothetical protein [Nostoc sp. DedQUE09]|uniref:hypothetical protein n=1 Tax=Nostoc sp. DedQUE09 TaxID=3075394 RepID=UPI002AD23B0A|nr:hypothetical protein [Nostoc sp. DedQUE09]MDZ7953511.1 hypothetical protein [Nostoc sp. DedQUE09]
MTWKEKKVASFLAGFYTIAVFLGGFKFDEITNFINPPSATPTAPSSSRPSLINILFALLFSGGGMFAFFEAVINAESETRANKNSSEFQKKIAAELKNIKTRLEKSNNIPFSERQRIVNDIDKITKETIEKFNKKKDATREIVKWIDKIERKRLPNGEIRDLHNGVLLADKGSSKAISECKIPEGKYQEDFKIDIRKCMNWLRDNLEAYEDLDVTQEQLASLRSIIPHVGGIKPYQVAFKLIEDDLESKSGNTGVTTDLVRFIIGKLS